MLKAINTNGNRNRNHPEGGQAPLFHFRTTLQNPLSVSPNRALLAARQHQPGTPCPTVWGPGPPRDGKTQVTIKYRQCADGSVEPLLIHTVLISTQHCEPGRRQKGQELPGYTGPDATEVAPSMEEMNELIIQHVVIRTLQDIARGRPGVHVYGGGLPGGGSGRI